MDIQSDHTYILRFEQSYIVDIYASKILFDPFRQHQQCIFPFSLIFFPSNFEWEIKLRLLSTFKCLRELWEDASFCLLCSIIALKQGKEIIFKTITSIDKNIMDQ